MAGSEALGWEVVVSMGVGMRVEVARVGQPVPLPSRGSVLLRDSYVNVDLEEEKECRVGYT